jgi:hypothetical protein
VAILALAPIFVIARLDRAIQYPTTRRMIIGFEVTGFPAFAGKDTECCLWILA